MAKTWLNPINVNLRSVIHAQSALATCCFFLFLLIFVAVTSPEYVQREKMWFVIGIDFIFVVIGVAKAVHSRASNSPDFTFKNNNEIIDEPLSPRMSSILSTNTPKPNSYAVSLEKGYNSSDPDEIYTYAISMSATATTEEEKKQVSDRVQYAAMLGSQKAKTSLDNSIRG